MDIDFVVLWVDPDDLAWQKEKAKWQERLMPGKNAADVRYRDWGLFPYWFRCVEENAPWVRKVHLVTNGQVPKWLDLSNPKLKLDIHSEFMMPDSVPTFSSHPIELQLDRIEDLSEHFVYFNDDMYLIQPVSPDFFFKDGKRTDCFCERHPLRFSGTGFSKILHNNIDAINSVLRDKRSVVKNVIGFSKWFSQELPLSYRVSNLLNYLFSRHFVGFSVEHTANAFTKTQFRSAREMFKPYFESTIQNKFRSGMDINQYIVRYWSIFNNDYTLSRNTIGGYYTLNEYNQACEAINGTSEYPVICINDAEQVKYKEERARAIAKAFRSRFPDKSSFEI